MSVALSQERHPAVREADVIRVLQNSLYPGARAESVAMVLAWCRSTGRDPMKKPIHIVPMWVRDATTGQGGMRDVLMPGIGTYRTDAATTGQYAGKDEPVFGPDETHDFDGMKVTYPSWCKITVLRIVAGEPRAFTAKEFWRENYATGKEKKGVNDMWRKRPYAQLAKCAESQALRMAFPDETGNTNTAEEMEGKTFEGMTLDGRAEPVTTRAAINREVPIGQPANEIGDSIPALDEPPAPKRQTIKEFLDGLERDLKAAQTAEAVDAIIARADVQKATDAFQNGAKERLNAMVKEALDRTADDFPGDVPEIVGAEYAQG